MTAANFGVMMIEKRLGYRPMTEKEVKRLVNIYRKISGIQEVNRTGSIPGALCPGQTIHTICGINAVPLFLSFLIGFAVTMPALARDADQASFQNSYQRIQEPLKPAVRDPIPARLLPNKNGRASDSITPPLKDSIPERLLIGKKIPPLLAPPAQNADKDKLVPPPGEEVYYPVRMDGQPFVLNVDRTVNLTDALNRFYYDPRWRGEVWVPFDQVGTIERATRLMATWREYNEFSTFRIFNRVNQFFERWSGYGP